MPHEAVTFWRYKAIGRMILLAGLCVYISSFVVGQDWLLTSGRILVLISIGVYGIGLILMRAQQEAEVVAKEAGHGDVP